MSLLFLVTDAIVLLVVDFWQNEETSAVVMAKWPPLCYFGNRGVFEKKAIPFGSRCLIVKAEMKSVGMPDLYLGLTLFVSLGCGSNEGLGSKLLGSELKCTRCC